MNKIKLSALIFTTALSYLYFTGSVDNSLTASDTAAIKKLNIGNQCSDTSTFNKEIYCIKEIQSSLQATVADYRCPTLGTKIEPMEFLQRGYGCCYDRARFIEKTLRSHGFKTRHVAIFHKHENYGILSIFVRKIASHAASEVLTKKGWMGVDSNEQFILLTKSGNPLTYSKFQEIIEQIAEPKPQATLFQHKLIFIYGLYSRHGMFHGWKIPAPEFVLSELRYNFMPN